MADADKDSVLRRSQEARAKAEQARRKAAQVRARADDAKALAQQVLALCRQHMTDVGLGDGTIPATDAMPDPTTGDPAGVIPPFSTARGAANQMSVATAQRHVIQAEQHVARVGRIIDRLSQDKHQALAETARLVLQTLEHSLRLAEEHLAREEQKAGTGRKVDATPDTPTFPP